MPQSNVLGEYIKQRRDALRLTQADLAQRLSDFGFRYSVQTVGHWETGYTAVPLGSSHGETSFLDALASVLDVSPLALLNIAGYLQGIDLKFDVETYELAQLLNKAT